MYSSLWAALPSSLVIDHQNPLFRKTQGKDMVKLETEPGKKRSKKGTSSKSLKSVDETKGLDLDSCAQPLMDENINADVDLSTNPAQVNSKKKRRKKKKSSSKANDHDKDDTQITEQTDIIATQISSDENQNKLENVEPDVEKADKEPFLDNENNLSVEPTVGQKKRRKKKKRRMVDKSNDKDGMDMVDQTETTSITSLSVQEKDELKRVDAEVALEIEESKEGLELKRKRRKEKKEKANDEDKLGQVVEYGSIIDVEEKRKERKEKRMRENANDKDGTEIKDKIGIRPIGRLERSKDQPKGVEEISRRVFNISIFDDNTSSDDDKTTSAKEKKKPIRRRRKYQQAENEACTQINEHNVEENRDKPNEVDDKSEQKEQGIVVNDENTPSAKENEEPKKNKKRKKKNKNLEANAGNGVQSEDQTVDNALMASNLSVGKTLSLFSKRKLLVLDINGLLADVVYPAPKNCRPPDKRTAGRAIFKRPFYLDFLNFCFERFDVGIWSSRTKKIINLVVDCLLGKLKQKLLFCWDVSHCTLSGFRTLENVHKPLVFKELRKIWENKFPNLPWEYGYYNESNTLLLDDSPYKALINPKNTAIFPRSFTYRDKQDTSLAPGGDIRVYLEKVAEAENIQKYVEQHPFGQVGIDETNQSWDFYSKVLSRRSLDLPSATQNSVCIPV